jgi:trans-2-enoyl-CoA reductase
MAGEVVFDVLAFPINPADILFCRGNYRSYGSMSGEDPTLSRMALGFRGIRLQGFNLGRGLAKRTPDQVCAIYADLVAKVRDGRLISPVETCYPIDDIKTALAHAQKGSRGGKVLVLPNGPL